MPKPIAHFRYFLKASKITASLQFNVVYCKPCLHKACHFRYDYETLNFPHILYLYLPYDYHSKLRLQAAVTSLVLG
jgi:hypothetical protein